MTNVRMQDDFYTAVNQEWLKTAEIPADKPATGGFVALVDEIDQQLMADFAKMSTAKNALLQHFLDYYELAADFQTRDALGMKPILPMVARVQSLDSLATYNRGLADWVLSGLPTPFGLSVDADMKDTAHHALYAEASDLILPDKTYYVADNPNADHLLAVFTDMMVQLLQKIGIAPVDATKTVKLALAFDRSLAPYVKSAEEAADYTKLYNPQPLSDFMQQQTTLDFPRLFSKVLPVQPEKIIVTEPKYFAQLSQLVTDANFETFKAWLLVMTVRSWSGYLNEEARQISSLYSRALSGSKEARPQQKSAYYLALGMFNQVVGDYYGRQYFGEAAKADVQKMVQKMIGVYQKRLEKNDWLTEKTRQQAIVKLNHLGIHVGYPDQIAPIFAKLVTVPKAEDGTLFENTADFIRTIETENFAKLTQPVDRNKWEMGAATVNAYYSPSKNIIVFPAAILQAPFYSLEQSSSANYGGIGAVIAHEISHAFDNNGAQFDEYGNMHNWWQESDLAHFKTLSEEMIAEFDGLEYAGATVNGKLTVSENIADAGGLSCALEAAKEEPDVDLAAFFVNWATIWRMKATKQYQQLLLNIDVHAPNALRANIQVQNLAAFYETFNVTKADQMYLAPAKRVAIW